MAGPFAIAGAVVQAVGAIRSAQSASAAADYNAQIAERNAALARDQAASDEQRQRIQARKQLGAMRAGYGASGVTLDGSPLDVLENSAAEAELDALTIRYKGEVSALGYRTESAQQRARSANATTEGYYNAGSALLQGGAKAYGMGSGNYAPVEERTPKRVG